MLRTWRSAFVAAMLAGSAMVSIAIAAHGEERSASFEIDRTSYITIGKAGAFGIPNGTSIRVRFGARDAWGGVTVSIDPRDLTIPPIKLGGASGDLVVALAEPAEGVARRAADGTVTFEIRAVVVVNNQGGTARYPLRFTTEAVEIAAQDGKRLISSRGMRLDPFTGRFTVVSAARTGPGSFTGADEPVLISLTGTLPPLPGL